MGRSTTLHLVPMAFVLFATTLVHTSLAGVILGRDDHHHHLGAPLLYLNETEIAMYHAPTPDSYYTIDWEGAGEPGGRYPALMITHIILMSLAFFVVLPMGIAMRSVKHAAHGIMVVVFYALVVFGCATSALYSKLTLNMYEGSAHGSQGYMVIVLSLVLTMIDGFAIFRRIFAFLRHGDNLSVKTFWEVAILGRVCDTLGPEYVELVSEEREALVKNEITLSPIRGSVELDTPRQAFDVDTARWANDVHLQHYRRQSATSDGTIYGSPTCTRSLDKVEDPKGNLKTGYLRQIGNGAFAVLERFLVFAALGQLLTGVVVYTGGCRGNYINGCLAHLIKGSIFWSYGLVTFARFLGTFSEIGWAWNRAPSAGFVSAEFVESLVIFLYGATNMWMERFGANAGDPFTTKQIQHISIAVMFCFAGLIGMGIESKRVRNWLAASTFASLSSARVEQDVVAEPSSYSASFNPFPALVIGVTGAAMAAHAQTYLYQVQIHALWGNLLVGFSVLRCLTYFFLWLGPPRSILPSRPPTEALGSFFLACGGLVFIFSTEEVSIAAMRRGRDDVMMFLNLAVAITCFAFCWTLFVVGFKGWLKSRVRPVRSYSSNST